MKKKPPQKRNRRLIQTMLKESDATWIRGEAEKDGVAVATWVRMQLVRLRSPVAGLDHVRIAHWLRSGADEGLTAESVEGRHLLPIYRALADKIEALSWKKEG
jgi:hypothetical protein